MILTFHGLGPPPASVPADERPYWLSAERFAAVLDRVAAARTAGRDVRLTFDDGNRSDLEIALPFLRARGLVADFFVLTGRFGRPRALSEADVQALVAAGMAVGLHGRDHLDWRRLDAAGLARETEAARARLASVLGRPVTAVSVPFGAYDRRVMAHLRRQGFAEILTSDGGATRPEATIKPRTSLRADTDDATLDAVIADRVPPVRRLRRALSRRVRRYLI